MGLRRNGDNPITFNLFIYEGLNDYKNPNRNCQPTVSIGFSVPQPVLALRLPLK